MTPKLSKKLQADFPKLYSPTTSGSIFNYAGFECDDGWEPLIRRLSAKLEPLGVRAIQVKEKFGGLRFYASWETDEAQDLIDAAATESFKVCERCGSQGEPHVNDSGWVKTLCSECALQSGRNFRPCDEVSRGAGS